MVAVAFAAFKLPACHFFGGRYIVPFEQI